MQKFIISAITLPVVIFLGAAVFGIQYNSHAKVSDMPSGIKYEINANQNIWPDNFYVSSYTSPEARSFSLDGYWTFEHSSHPFAGPVWVYHTNQLTITESDFTVNTISR